MQRRSAPSTGELRNAHERQLRGELSTATTAPHGRAAEPRTAWSVLAAALSDPNLQCIAIFCAIGLLLELNVLLRLSDSGTNLVGTMFQ